MPRMCSRNEINDYPVRRLTGVAETCLIINSMHRESLVLQRFSHSHVDELTEISNGRSWRSFQHKWHKPGNHARHRLSFRMHTPADRKIERDLRTLRVEPPHQQRAP